MAYADNKTGTGFQIVFATSSWTAPLDDISPEFFKRAVIDITASTDTVQKKIPTDQPDPGKVSIKGHFNPSTPPPWTSANETIKIVYPATAGGSTNATATTRQSDAFDGFVTDFKPSISRGKLMTFSLEVEFSGTITSVQAT